MQRAEIWMQNEIEISGHGWIQESEDGWLTLLDGENGQCHLFAERHHAQKAYRKAFALFLRYNIPIRQGTFLHCAAIQVEQQTFLFLASSNTGKTTLSQKATQNGYPVLSDELVFVAPLALEFVAHGTPAGEISDGPIQGVIAAVFFLQQGPGLVLSRLSASRAFERAWADSLYRDQVLDIGHQSFVFQNNLVDTEDRKLIFDQWYALFSVVPCFELALSLDFDDWDVLIDAVSAAR